MEDKNGSRMGGKKSKGVAGNFTTIAKNPVKPGGGAISGEDLVPFTRNDAIK